MRCGKRMRMKMKAGRSAASVGRSCPPLQWRHMRDFILLKNRNVVHESIKVCHECASTCLSGNSVHPICVAPSISCRTDRSHVAISRQCSYQRGYNQLCQSGQMNITGIFLSPLNVNFFLVLTI
jgi:hypothetical protein